MRSFIVSLVCACLGMLGLAAITAAAQEPKAELQPLSEVSLEIQALRILNILQLTPEQLAQLQKTIKETAQPPRERPSKATKAYGDLLLELRIALTTPNDERVGELEEQLAQAAEKDPPELDEVVETTDAARRHAPAVARSLKPYQVTALLTQLIGNVADPRDKLLEALVNVRDLTPKEWKEQRDGLAYEVAQLLAGVDTAKADRLGDLVTALLIKARYLTDEEFRAQRPDLEKQARQLLGDVGPFEVLRNSLEQTLADFLSNPQLDAAVTRWLQ